jgi:hypothetical protein
MWTSKVKSVFLAFRGNRFVQAVGVICILAGVVSFFSHPFFAGPRAAERYFKTSPFWQSMRPGVWVIYDTSGDPECPELRYGEVRRVGSSYKGRMPTRVVWIYDTPSLMAFPTILEISAWAGPQIMITGTERSEELAQLFGGVPSEECQQEIEEPQDEMLLEANDRVPVPPENSIRD